MTAERIPLGMRLSERFGRWAMQRLAGEIVVSVALAVGGRPFARTRKPS